MARISRATPKSRPPVYRESRPVFGRSRTKQANSEKASRRNSSQQFQSELLRMVIVDGVSPGRYMAFVQQPEDAVKPGHLLELRLRSRFQIAEQVIFSMTRTVDQIILV